MTAGGAGPRRIGAIDIGTNSVLLLIVEERDGALFAELDRATITRLGEGVDRTRTLAPEAAQRTLWCLSDYARELRGRSVARLGVVGTSALRDAQGGAAFLDEAERILGERPQVISGLAEATLTFEGALSGLELNGPVSVFDVGGGSTEVIAGRAGGVPSVSRAVSLDIGSVRLFERYAQHDPPSDSELSRAVADIASALERAPSLEPGARLVGVAGTVTTMAAIALGLDAYDGAKVHGHVLDREQVVSIADRLARLPLAERMRIAGLEPRRADVMVMGAEIVRRVQLWAGTRDLVVSDRGVRWGVAQRLAANRDLCA